MLAPKDLVRIGRVLKANGTDGQAVIGIYRVAVEDINTEEPVFIDFDGSPVPFFIESIVRRGQNRALVRLRGIRSLSDVDEILGSDISVEASSLPDREPEGDLRDYLNGWLLYNSNVSPETPDKNKTGAAATEKSGKSRRRKPAPVKVGPITDVIDIPGNPLLEVETENGTALVPFNEDLVTGLDPSTRAITLSIPSGLL